MNKIEFVFGVAVLVFSVLSILFINFGGVVPSRFFPGHYTYSDLVGLSFFSFLLVPIVGFVAFGHGIYRRRLRELGLGIVILLWGFYTWFWISMCLIDGTDPYIKGSVADYFNEMLYPIIPGIFLGIALMLDGTLRKHYH